MPKLIVKVTRIELNDLLKGHNGKDLSFTGGFLTLLYLSISETLLCVTLSRRKVKAK